MPTTSGRRCNYNIDISALIMLICTAVIASLLHGLNLLVSKLK